MDVSRRQVAKALSLGLASGLFHPAWPTETYAQMPAGGSKREARVNLLGFSLGIHIPAIAAVVDILPTMPNYAPPKVVRIPQNRTLTQTLIAGAADVGEADVITIFQAVAAGAKLKIVGNVYNSTSIVFVANADKIQGIQDLAKSGVVVAVNGVGDVSHAMLVGPLMERGIALQSLTVIEIGGSGDRMRALLSKRVDAVPIHFDQAASVISKGNFKVLLKPWQEYPIWLTEAWAVEGSWLKQPDNQRMVVDLLKATITAFRAANNDLGWYAEKYRKHCSLPNASEATQEQLRPAWRTLVEEVKAWPPSLNFSTDHYRQLLPIYKAAGAITKDVDVEQVIDTTYATQALKELGA
jgi:NitT/TauT family transport system substrate-binding protein